MSNGFCPSCGATVNIPEGANEVQCEYCKTLVKEEEATHEFEKIKKSPYGDLLLIADTALEGNSFLDAYNFYNRILEISPTFSNAWLKKGIAMIKMSAGSAPKIIEAIGSWKIAVKCAKNSASMRKRVALEISNVITDFYPIFQNNFRKTLSEGFIKFSGGEAFSYHLSTAIEDIVSEHLNHFLTFESALEYAVQLDKNPIIIRNVMNLCDKMLSSMTDEISKNVTIEGHRGSEIIDNSYAAKKTQIKNDEKNLYNDCLASDSGYRPGSGEKGALLGSFSHELGDFFDQLGDLYRSEEEYKERRRERERQSRERIALRSREIQIESEKRLIEQDQYIDNLNFFSKKREFEQALTKKISEKILKIKSKYENLLLEADPKYALKVKRKKEEEELKRKKEEEERKLREAIEKEERELREAIEKEDQVLRAAIEREKKERKEKINQDAVHYGGYCGLMAVAVNVIFILIYVIFYGSGEFYDEFYIVLVFMGFVGFMMGFVSRKDYLKSHPQKIKSYTVNENNQNFFINDNSLALEIVRNRLIKVLKLKIENDEKMVKSTQHQLNP